MSSASQLQTRFPARALDLLRPQDCSTSSAQSAVCRQEEQRPRMLWSTRIPAPAQHAAAVPWGWRSSVDLFKIMAKVAEQ